MSSQNKTTQCADLWLISKGCIKLNTVPGYEEFAAYYWFDPANVRIWSNYAYRWLKPNENNTSGYLWHSRMATKSRGVYKPVHLHRVQAALKQGRQKPGQHVRHLDNDRLNNKPENLTYGTAKENAEDQKQAGSQRGLTEQQEIDALYTVDGEEIRNQNGSLEIWKLSQGKKARHSGLTPIALKRYLRSITDPTARLLSLLFKPTTPEDR